MYNILSYIIPKKFSFFGSLSMCCSHVHLSNPTEVGMAKYLVYSVFPHGNELLRQTINLH